MTITRTGPFEPRDGPPASDTAPTAPDGPSAAPRPTPASWAPFGPARIGRYEILREIASGGMGRVYLGRAVGPLGFEKLVAIKTIHGELAKEQAFVDMFFDEARIASRIDHENVCRVFDFGEADGQYFLAMEYLVGVNLGRVLRALARKEHAKDDTVDAIAAHVIAEAAEALHAAHELADEHGRPLGVVHRDVSPQNIFLTFDGGVRVVDFGIASAEGRRHQTATGSLKGKFAYMAPEQLHREKADRRADVWALGVVLWELLTRERAFRAGTEIETVLAVLNDPVRHPREVRPTLDPNLDAIVMAALVKDRAERFENARALSRALRQWIVSKGQVVGSIEVAELLAVLLPEERREAMALVDEARRTPARASSVPGTSVRPAAPSAGAGTAAEMTRDLAAPPIVAHDGSAEQARAPAETAESARAVRPRWQMLVGVGVGVAVLAALGVATLGGSPPNASSSVAPATTRGGSSAPPSITSIEPSPVEPSQPRDPAVPSEPVDTSEPVTAPTTTDSSPSAPASSETRSLPGRRRPARPAATTGATASPASTMGVLAVTTPGGWADVYANGRLLGRTPLTTQLPPGSIELELRPFTLVLPDDPRVHRTVQIGDRIVQVSVPLGSDGHPR